MRLLNSPRAILCGLLLLASLGSGCTDRQATAEIGPLPIAPTAYPTGPASAGPGVASVSEDIQALTIRIEDGQFGSDIYDMQLRPARIEVWSSGDTLTFAIDELVNAHSLDADGTSVIGLSPSSPGRYTMRLSGESSDTATLNVRAAGER